jgi:tetratricopeptide (TPR) repeat protein
MTTSLNTWTSKSNPMNQHIQRAQLLIQQGRFEQAQQELGQAIADDSEAADAFYLLAIVLNEQKKYREATEAVQNAIRLEPGFAGAHTVLGDIYLDRNMYPEAEQSLNEALRLDPYNERTWGALSRLYFNQKKWDLAIEHAQKGLEIDPEDALCENMLTISLERSGRKDAALERSAESLRKNPDDSYAHASHGWTMLQSGQYKAAQEHFREALRLDPENEFAKEGMIQALNSNNLIFRIIFKWYSWISRLPARTQWIIILGLYFGQRVLVAIGNNNPAVKPFVLPIVFAYILFAVMTWITNPLFNTFLRFNRFGKYLLNSHEKMASNFLAGMIIFGLVTGLLSWIFVSGLLALFFGAYSLMMLIPISGTAAQQARWTFAVMLSICIALGMLGMFVLGLLLFGIPFSGGAAIFAFGILGVSFLSNFLAQFKEKY